MKTILQGGTILTAADTYQADLLLEGERIALIGKELPVEGAQVIDAQGLYVMPGGIDVHTHLDLPVGGTTSSDDFYTGHRAAAFGGTTAHIDFATQDKGGTLHQAIDAWHEKAEGKAAIDYGFHIAITDPREAVLQELPSLVDEGVTSLKLYMAYKGTLQVDDMALFRGLLQTGQAGMLMMVHAENGDAIDILVKRALADGHVEPIYHALTRPDWLEGEATGRAIALAAVAGTPLYVVHVTCAKAVDQIGYGRDHHTPVMGETCPQYLLFTQTDLTRPNFEGAKWVCSPPLRTQVDQEALWAALANNTLQVVSTDHCPFFFDGTQPGALPGKELGHGSFAHIPNGIPGIEDRLSILWHFGVNGGRISANRFVDLVSTNPARIFGLYPRKGTIAPGADADLVLWDPQRERTISAQRHHMRTDYNVYEGQTVRGGPVKVLLRGQVIVDGDRWLGEAGTGRFLRRGTASYTGPVV